MKPLTLVIDLDGVLTVKKEWIDYSDEDFLSVEPDVIVIGVVNTLFDSGNRIIIHTSRRWEDENVTKVWLSKHGVKFHVLVLGKPLGDHYIDDKNMSVKELVSLYDKNTPITQNTRFGNLPYLHPTDFL